MRYVDVEDARTHLTQLLEAVERGESIAILRDDQPVADLVPHQGHRVVTFGGFVGEIAFAEHDLRDADLEVEALFEHLS